MLWRRHKPLKMIWRVEKGNAISFLVGSAHFFPYSFRRDLEALIGRTRAVWTEGPLDRDSLARVELAGRQTPQDGHLLDLLDERVVAALNETLFPACRRSLGFGLSSIMDPALANPLYELTKGMKPWLTFFTIWSAYLERRGWRFSVDLETHRIASQMGVEVGGLERIEEQIAVLENLSVERIGEFLARCDLWENITRSYVRAYLAGDLAALRHAGTRFPSRHAQVIHPRDRILFQRMRNALEVGGVLVCIGAPHVPGLAALLRNNGFRLQGPEIPPQW